MTPRRKVIRWVEEDRGYETPCWIWQLATNDRGYGKSWRQGTGRHGRGISAHREAYEDRYGSVPEGLVVDHLCSQPNCVNPGHLEAVTQSVNARRGKNGKLTEEQLREILSLCEQGWVKTDIATAYGVGVSYVSGLASRHRREEALRG